MAQIANIMQDDSEPKLLILYIIAHKGKFVKFEAQKFLENFFYVKMSLVPT